MEAIISSPYEFPSAPTGNRLGRSWRPIRKRLKETAENSEAWPAKRQTWDQSNNSQEKGLLEVVGLLPLIPLSRQSPAMALATNGHKMANLLTLMLLVSGDMLFLWGHYWGWTQVSKPQSHSSQTYVPSPRGSTKETCSEGRATKTCAFYHGILSSNTTLGH